MTHADMGLRCAAPGLLDGDMPRRCGWGEAVGYLRQYSSSFADLNLKVKGRAGMDGLGGGVLMCNGAASKKTVCE